jgi:Fe-S cluster assembly protein SufB
VARRAAGPRAVCREFAAITRAAGLGRSGLPGAAALVRVRLQRQRRPRRGLSDLVGRGGTTIQNWSNNVYNLVTKRAVAQTGATMEWIDGNIGSKVTMKYPAVYLMGEHARGETLSVAFAGTGQHQDAGAKMVHCAPHTSSTIVSKSVARAGGRTSYRGLVQVQDGAAHAKSTVKCDALLVDTVSRSDTYPYVDVREDDVQMGHEASVSKISEDQLFYLRSRLIG